MFKMPQNRNFHHRRPERPIGKYERSWSSRSTPPIDALYRCTTCGTDSSISWPLRRTSLTASLPSSSVAMRQTSRLSCHFTSITPFPLVHFTDAPCRRYFSPSVFVKSLRFGRVVPHRYVFSSRRASSRCTDVK